MSKNPDNQKALAGIPVKPNNEPNRQEEDPREKMKALLVDPDNNADKKSSRLESIPEGADEKPRTPNPVPSSVQELKLDGLNNKADEKPSTTPIPAQDRTGLGKVPTTVADMRKLVNGDKSNSR